MFWSKKSTEGVDSPPEPSTLPKGPAKKGQRTPTRREAEAARKQRRNPVLSKAEVRARQRRSASADRLRATEARDNTAEKRLLRDFIDSRFSIGEFLVPFMVVMLGVSMLGQAYPQLLVVTTAGLYSYIILTLVDIIMMWRAFKKVLAERLPGTSAKGLLTFAMGRVIQIRRFRTPKPRIKRGEEY